MTSPAAPVMMPAQQRSRWAAPIAMRFLSVAERELRAAARRSRTFFVRWITGLAFFGVLLWLFWAFDVFRNRNAAPEVFEVLAVLTFIYCLFVGTAATADCLSAEKREGTLGLLFLTNLNSVEIVAGKLCSRALATVYGLVAIFPMLAMPLLMGGVTFGHFWQTILALLNAIFFSLAAGFVASVICVRQFTAIATATGLAFLVGAGLMGAAAAVDAARGPRIWVDILASLCPLYTLVSADGTRIFGRNHYWLSLGAVAALSALWLLWATWRLSRTWRDRPKAASIFSKLSAGRIWQRRESAGRISLRRRLLDQNPFYWLAGRRRVSSPFVMFLAVVLVVIAIGVALPFFDRTMRFGTASPVLAFMFTWLWTGLAFHALVLYYAAMVASQRLAEDKNTGALELVLSTPTSESTISRGLWLAFGRRLFFPGLTAVLFHLFFVWIVAVALVADPPTSLAPGVTPSQLLWHAFAGAPVSGYPQPAWEFPFMLRTLLHTLGIFMLAWVTLGWVGRWLGLKMKHPGFAPLTALALLIIPPVLEFTLACFLADKLNLDRLPEQQFLPLMVWVAIGIAVLHCALLSWWAAGRLRRDFRTAVTERYQPPVRRRWWPGWRPVRRLALRAAAGVAVLALVIVVFYQYQNWRSRRDWAAFQAKLQQNGQSLDTATLWPAPVPDELNFALSPAFAKTSGNRGTAFLGRVRRLETANLNYWNSPSVLKWPEQKLTAFDEADKWMSPVPASAGSVPRPEAAAALIAGLQREAKQIQALAEAARLPFFRIKTDQNVQSLMHAHRPELRNMEQLHFLFQLRACALLEVGRGDEAARDVLTSLRLTRLARQSPDVLFCLREQNLLARSLQPIWEGMADRQWTDAQLAAFQQELAGFDLAADYTNAVRRLVLVHIESWKKIPDSPASHISVPVSSGGYMAQSGWQWQPRGWWLDRCTQLYQAGENAIGRVDLAGGRVKLNVNWSDLRGLPLDSESQQLLQQHPWNNHSPSLMAFAQTAVNQAIIACALERFRIAHARYPETLDELLPVYLERIPNDLLRGRPLIYQRTDDGRYCLRGVGPNLKEDRKTASSDDWRWAYPTNAPTLKQPGGR